MSLYEQYMNALDRVGEAILTWADPENRFRGYTADWPLADFPSAFNVATAYLIAVLVGSAIMKLGVPALDPYPLKFMYNVSQIFLCAYMTIESLFLAYRNDYPLKPCFPYNQKQPALAHLMWLFYVSKVWDFWDTAFIILGKKWRQLSFLHVYHHFTIFLVCWIDVHVFYDGDIYLTIFLNAFIHTVMYTYYFICMHTKDPVTGKSLPIWWKSSLTLMQLIQFVTMMSQGIYGIVTQCQEVSLRVTGFYIVYIFSLFLLFAQFFMESYVKPKSKKEKFA